jgi:20S proteasome alpha/beta subunit
LNLAGSPRTTLCKIEEEHHELDLGMLLLFLTLVTLLQRVDAARSLSARKVRARSSSSGERYDRSITTFSPDGRLLQLEYALIAAEERGRGLTVCVECDGVVIFAFPSGDNEDAVDDDDFDQSVDSDVTETNTDHSNAQSQAVLTATIDTEHDPAHNTKIHRLSPTHLLLTSGLAGDSRVLASAFRRVASSWTHMQYGEVVSARELSKEMGKVVHGIGLRPGARVLGVIGMLIGLDDTDDCNTLTKNNSLGVEVRMYRCLPGGTLDRCNVCCMGGGADAAGNAARKYATETLARVMSSNKYKGDKESESKEDMADSNENKLEQVIEEVGKIALKYHHDSLIRDGDINDAVLDNNTPKKRVAVDIWLVKAASTDSLDTSTINRHRYLGQAIMKTIYARSVELKQLSNAIKCLMDNNANEIIT